MVEREFKFQRFWGKLQDSWTGFDHSVWWNISKHDRGSPWKPGKQTTLRPLGSICCRRSVC